MLLTPSPCHKLSHFLGPPPPSSVTYFMDGPFLSRNPDLKKQKFLDSFIPAISIAPLQVLYYSEALPTTARNCIGGSRRSAQATAGKGLAQGPYMAARAGVEPTTLRLRVITSTNAPPCPSSSISS